MNKLLLPLSLLCLIVTLVACDKVENTHTETISTTEFLTRHWPAVLPAQGEPPATFTHQEASLDPKICGECHVAQFQQWQTSLHSHSMGPGIQWQLKLMGQQQGNKCLRCHAPLTEQKALVSLNMNWPNVPNKTVPEWIPEDLADSGLVCAGCHLRRHQRFGPPSKQSVTGELPHDGFTASQAFQDSRFCAACHQHNIKENPPTVNGKLLEDTLHQWQQSPQAKQGVQCQGCHMPDRQHLWRGIHDADMTRSALAIQMQVKRTGKNSATVDVTLSNRGAGHHLPTYMVPKINLIFTLKQAETAVEQEFHRYVIGWMVNVELTQEQFDTRIAAGESRQLVIPVTLPNAEVQSDVELTVNVIPREHYERTFKNSLKSADRIPQQALLLLRSALKEAEATRYPLLQIEQPVPLWSIAK